MKFIFRLGVIIVTVFVFSCIKKKQEIVKIPSRQVLDAPCQFLIPREEYVRIYRDQDVYSPVIAIVYRGDILQLKNTNGEDAIHFMWYNVVYKDKKGWILVKNPIKVYSKERAEYLSMKLSLKK